jgi:universal stress protein A
MASRGAGFFEKLLLGSTSEMIIKEADCPVLITRGERDFVDFEKDEIILKNILCPVDFSETSGKALKSASFLANKFGAKLTLIYVVEEMFEAMDFLLDNFSVDEFNEKREDIAKKKLKEFCDKYVDPGIKCSKEILRGNPKKEISEYARDNKNDLIVIGAYGRGEEDGIVFSGSVSMKVIKTTDCPVLVVR